eukprot:368857-Pelagomonas_calceolata.AAC.13
MHQRFRLLKFSISYFQVRQAHPGGCVHHKNDILAGLAKADFQHACKLLQAWSNVPELGFAATLPHLHGITQGLDDGLHRG